MSKRFWCWLGLHEWTPQPQLAADFLASIRWHRCTCGKVKWTHTEENDPFEEVKGRIKPLFDLAELERAARRLEDVSE